VGSMQDWQQLVRDEHSGLLDTEWVFASTQRVGVDGGAKDSLDLSELVEPPHRPYARRRRPRRLAAFFAAPRPQRDYIAGKASGVVSSLVLATRFRPKATKRCRPRGPTT